MRSFRVLVGSVFIAIGLLAALAGDFDERLWWVVAVAIAVAGVLGVASALRSPESASS